MLGKLLKKERISQGKTISGMVDKVGFKSTYLSDIENGRRVPKNGYTLKKLADGYGVDFDKVLDCLIDDIKSEVE